MKKIVAFILFTCMVLSLFSCGKVEITMQEIYDAGNIAAILENHQSVYICDLIGTLNSEKYLTKEYVCVHLTDEEFAMAEFVTDDAKYAYSDGEYLRYLYIAPDGVTNDFTSERAQYYAFVFGEDILDDTIGSVSQKDGTIIVNSVLAQQSLEQMAEYEVVSAKSEYVLDDKNREMISNFFSFTYDDGAVESAVTNFTYDVEAPEMIGVFMDYAKQTEDLRNVTIVSNPGTEKVVSQTFRMPKGLIAGFSWDDAFEDKVELYADADCKEPYDPYVDTDSDLTVYVKWNI